MPKEEKEEDETVDLTKIPKMSWKELIAILVGFVVITYIAFKVLMAAVGLNPPF